jgi:hypothetical protein
VGSDVVFRGGQFNPGTPTGQRTIAHELAHVVQQSQGPVDGADAAGGIRVSDPSDRFERAADHQADEVMASVQTSRATPASSATGTQVAQLDEDETAQMSISAGDGRRGGRGGDDLDGRTGPGPRSGPRGSRTPPRAPGSAAPGAT